MTCSCRIYHVSQDEVWVQSLINLHYFLVPGYHVSICTQNVRISSDTTLVFYCVLLRHNLLNGSESRESELQDKYIFMTKRVHVEFDQAKSLKIHSHINGQAKKYLLLDKIYPPPQL